VPEETFVYPLSLGGVIGRRTGELHAAFATPTEDRDFAAEPITGSDVARWVDDTGKEIERGYAILSRAEAGLPDAVRTDVAALAAAKEQIMARLEAVRAHGAAGLKTRVHGDYHLGQVLVAQDDVMIIDFEGEPQRDLAARRRKSSALVDVAGMVRSFDYAAWAALDRLQSRRGEVEPRVHDGALAWRDHATATFLDAYWEAAAAAAFLPAEPEARLALLDLFKIRKAFYEIGYEAANRPTWLSIPIRGLLDLIASDRPAA
jgi:maltose alpha-D-glucosyltransferase/alpha-amylase